MKKSIVSFAIVLVLLCTPLLSLAAARYPTLRGTVTDDTNVLSEDLVKDIAKLNERAEDDTDVRLHVALVHFLDGENVQTYANTLFERWDLGKTDFLLVGAVGEDRFATVTGDSLKEQFSDANAQNLLYSSRFSDLFKAQQYNEALAQYFIAFADMLNKQYSVKIKTSNLFSQYRGTVQSNPSPAVTNISDFASGLWGEVRSAIDAGATEYERHQEERRGREGNGMSATGWIVLVVLFVLIFGNRSSARKGRARGGCGCAPIGWIIGLLGLHSLFGRDK